MQEARQDRRSPFADAASAAVLLWVMSVCGACSEAHRPVGDATDAGRSDVGVPDASRTDATLRDLAPADSAHADADRDDAGAPRCAPFEVPLAGGGVLGMPPVRLGPGTYCQVEGFHIAPDEAAALEAHSALLQCGTPLSDVGSSCAFVRPFEQRGLTVEQWNQICELEEQLGPREWFCWFLGD